MASDKNTYGEAIKNSLGGQQDHRPLDPCLDDRQRYHGAWSNVRFKPAG